ncbi:unnamed protein product [Blepharisma stoltei]|uniref:Uncharacterized protein n=1 Tax=Blepharisma stoltei TaxID=1481888 RepID=A0AAU9J3X9_9CILI|nr:unnamed protein product [Blepharisma stoltei]
MELQPLNNLNQSSYTYFPARSTKKPGFFSMTFFTWVKSILDLSKKKDVTSDDTYPLPDEEKAENEELTQNLKKHKLFWAIILSNLKLILLSIFLGNACALLDLSAPLLIKWLISYIESEEKPLTTGVYILLAFSAIHILNQILKGRVKFNSKLIEIRVKNSLANAIYGKVLKASKVPEGLGVNVLEVDAEKIYSVFIDLGLFISCPVQAVLSIYLIYLQVGSAVFAGLGVLLMCLSLSYFSSSLLKKFQSKTMAIKDERIEMSSQLVRNIKIIKAYVWENFFKNLIHDIRKRELSSLKSYNLAYSGASYLFWSTPSLTAASVFVYYTQIMEKSLNPEVTFVTLSTLLILQDSLQEVPYILTSLILCFVSIKRVQKFLDVSELRQLPKGDTVEIKNCSFECEGKTLLNCINLNLKKNEFIAIVGPVGSGKSSLLNAIMGELKVESGEICVNDQIAYAPSLESWLQNDSLRNNILFGKPYNESWYMKVIDACCLSQDISSLPDKDFTEIGEKGINLSGGQKARVCLARAVYADKEIYLLDDPLSSVDNFVANSIMNNCFLNLLSNKTRILVTHRLNILDKVDRIIVLEDGKISQISEPATLSIQESLIEKDNSEPQEIPHEPKKLIEDEEKESGKVSSKVYKDYFKFSGGYTMLALTCLSVALWTTTRVSGDIVLKEWSSNPSDTSTLLVLYLCLRVGGSIFVPLRAIFLNYFLGNRASQNIHDKMIESFIRAPINLFYDVTPTGRILNRLSKDIDKIDATVPLVIGYTLVMLSEASAAIFMALIYFPHLVIALPLFIYFALKIKDAYLGASRELTRLEAISKSPILNHFSETLTGAKLIRAFKQTEVFHAKNYDLLNSNSRILYSLGACYCWINLYLGLLTSAFIFLLLCTIILLRYDLSAATVGLCLAYVIPLPIDMSYLIFDLAYLENSVISVERAEQYMNIPVEKPSQLQTDKNLFRWPENPSIEFRNVFMKYRPDTPYILKGVNFKIKGSKRIGFVGRTGSGKSSVFLALLRIVEIDKGIIFIDGVDISHIGLDKLRSAITLVPQDPLVFSSTLRKNLDPCQLKSDDEIKKALEEVNLSKFSIDHDIKGSGSNLSAGEKQLISIARAMLANTKVILFDEATAGVDQESDHEIQNLIKGKFFGCTILTIAHRLITVMESDFIIVMQDGIAAEIGSPEELSQKDSLFRKIKDQIH